MVDSSLRFSKHSLKMWDVRKAWQWMGVVLEAWKQIMFPDFFKLETFTTKNYETDESNMPPEERSTMKANRLAGYQKIILAGLGTMFWGTATSVLSHLENRLVHWLDYSITYCSLALLLMLLGLCASTFPSSSPLAAGMAGLGGWQAFLFTLVTFHVASEKYYSNAEKFLSSLWGILAVATLYWGFTMQDPLPLHIIVKAILWVVCLPFFATFFLVYRLINGILWFISWILIDVVWMTLKSVSDVFHFARGYRLHPEQGGAHP